MNKTEVKLKYEVCDAPTGGIPVIIAAAGSSVRMGTNKLLMECGGIPVIAKTLLAFESCPTVSGIILVVRAEDVFTLQMLAEKYGISKLTDIVCGGSTRQESVLKGLSRLDSDCELALIHDGARPLVSNEIIRSVADALKTHSAAVCCVKLKDTVKQIDEKGKIVRTLDRSSLVAVQTPQGVRIADYTEAVNKIGDVSAFTDDTSIMEAAGFEVATVEGSYTNIKITTPEDIAVAESFLSEEEE